MTQLLEDRSVAAAIVKVNVDNRYSYQKYDLWESIVVRTCFHVLTVVISLRG